jgi:1-acyl-sn-glycerol-3-phosphate acyltransferase
MLADEMIGRARTALGLIGAAIATFPLAAAQVVVMKTGIANEAILPRLWHRIVLGLLGIRVHVRGEMLADRPLLIAANHISWTDIHVIGALGNVGFVAKSEMGGWPVIGKLSRLQRTIYVDRERRRSSGKQVSEIGQRLAAGDAMIFFAEGSTADGNFLKPFKSTLFGAAQVALQSGDIERVTVQPVAIAYTRLHGLPMGRSLRPHSAWIGDRKLVPHIVQLLQEGAVDVEVHFGEPIDFGAGADRKAVARLAEARVRAMMIEALRNPKRYG